MRRTLLLLAPFLVAGSLFAIARGPEVRTGGPVSPGADITRGQPIDSGVEYSLGWLLVNEGQRPAVLERVRVLGVTGPIEILGALAAVHPGTRGPMISLFGFPPQAYPAKPLADENVVPVASTFSENGSPQQGLQLEVGVRLTGDGIGKVKGIEVVYRVGSRRYRIINLGGGILCAPAALYREKQGADDDCGGPATDPHFDDKFVEFRVPTKKST